MLAGAKRIELLRQLHAGPGRSVSELGAAVGIKRSDASQELRRIQSRGLLKCRRQGVPLIYRMESDPQVSSAAPLLKALQTAFSGYPVNQDSRICGIAHGLASARREAIVRTLMNAPKSAVALRTHLNLSAPALAQNILTLMYSGFIKLKTGQYHFRCPAHPVARALIKLLPPPG